MELSPRARRLWEDLRELHEGLRAETFEMYGRMNPFVEDLFNWRERGRAWTRDDRGVTIYNSTTLVGDVEIGEGSWIGPFCSLDGSHARLSVGQHCAVSLGCQLLTHDTARWALSGGHAPYESAPTKIGNCTFLGTLAVIAKGVTVGDHCLVGAGAVVTRDIPDRTIAAGVPARRIGEVESAAGGRVELRYDPD